MVKITHKETKKLTQPPNCQYHISGEMTEISSIINELNYVRVVVPAFIPFQYS